ncbi:MAG: hypothetical protein VX740_10515, partial [Pseudomonadota bacterium]|nr:hypothetical protein [Pseudomonadota bacterium]
AHSRFLSLHSDAGAHVQFLCHVGPDYHPARLTLVVAKLHTGRTHQIRVHSAYMGCPLIGYFKYGYDPELFAQINLKKRLHLHAYRLRLPHPANRKKILDLQAPIPDDFVANMKELGFDHSIKADNIQFEI